jgi:hypothetical protein
VILFELKFFVLFLAGTHNNEESGYIEEEEEKDEGQSAYDDVPLVKAKKENEDGDLDLENLKNSQLEELVRQLCLEVGPKELLNEIIRLNKWSFLAFFFFLFSGFSDGQRKTAGTIRFKQSRKR